MIDIYLWTTPNGYKPMILLEELGIDYRIKPVDINKDEQFEPAFLAIAPNNRIPAIVDHAPRDLGEPIAIFESGALMEYLADKHEAFIPQATRPRAEVLQWLHWQMGGFGPMLGQNHHFNLYAPEKIPYAIDRYVGETKRLYGVLDRRLKGRDFVAGDYSIADMAIWPWAFRHTRQSIKLSDFPEVKRWYEAMLARPAVQAALKKTDDAVAAYKAQAEAAQNDTAAKAAPKAKAKKPKKAAA